MRTWIHFILTFFALPSVSHGSTYPVIAQWYANLQKAYPHHPLLKKVEKIEVRNEFNQKNTEEKFMTYFLAGDYSNFVEEKTRRSFRVIQSPYGLMLASARDFGGECSSLGQDWSHPMKDQITEQVLFYFHKDSFKRLTDMGATVFFENIFREIGFHRQDVFLLADSATNSKDQSIKSATPKTLQVLDVETNQVTTMDSNQTKNLFPLCVRDAPKNFPSKKLIHKFLPLN